MKLVCSVEDCVAEVYTSGDPEHSEKGKRSVYVCLKDPQGDVLSQIKVPWPSGEPEPSEVDYEDSNECLKLTNNATFATVPIRVSKLREVLVSQRSASLPKRFSTFSNPLCPINDTSQQDLYNALKDFVKNPLEEGKWKRALKQISAKDANADGFLTKEEQLVILHFLPTQSFSSKEWKSTCEALLRSNTFGPRYLGHFYELCLNLDQISVVRSVIESRDAPLSEQSLAVFLNFVAGKYSVEEPKEDNDMLLACLLSRRFDPRRMIETSARKITTQNAAVLLHKCMELYVSTNESVVAEQALSLMSVLTDTFGSRIVWENDLHNVAKKGLEFVESMSEIISCFKQVELNWKQLARIRDEEDADVQYRIAKISLPRRTMKW